jgi:hypothetical protein
VYIGSVLKGVWHAKFEAKMKVWKHKYDKIWGWIGGWEGGGFFGVWNQAKVGVCLRQMGSEVGGFGGIF